jgi:hypothetical protein
MNIEPIPFSAFQSLISCAHALREPDNGGCAWYATTDRRVAGRLYINAQTEQFCPTVLHFVRAGWEVKELRHGYDAFEDAEAALFQAMTELTGKPVTTKDMPVRLRFGKRCASQTTDQDQV